MITYLIIGTTAIVSFICFERRDLLNKLSFCPYAAFKRGEWYRLITHGFVHADMTHLFVNMFTLWSFGVYMEPKLGANGLNVWAFLGLYFGGMIFASCYDLFKYRDNIYYQSIGASGAVSAVLFSSFIFDPWGRIFLFAIIPLPGILFGLLYLVYCQYMARHSSDNINHNAHFYGAIYGLAYPILLNHSLLSDFIDMLTGFY
ncbi:membrane associated rhomboid family serine protease [Parabacteroides sp. PF5-5]|uniref:rhomboid family intramembrane serine protease n=1 Tax=unclassified Parabacteroides TaxID=2649774 RepID=UPI002473F34C|nr:MULTISPECIES: rhomboid family intramembrane serine protease [unclassified Parabacteroides]MDH6304392.1 membrane associated rhomboid family serine protease [Parabacteroides sp. PH5-39]MDH6315455.1 membrane associated rhomboid family serine protease [Parabacteroides sp. PF5-13]MDH6319051.1 membrane associated rhomboid family serine protease [Parabacteroides sp. PH5-13]MDH6322781.1 membrane associated rhomboid family serine protease [Parabacteroides sp. PH5-8]MDH6326647.1 membrane associated r